MRLIDRKDLPPQVLSQLQEGGTKLFDASITNFLVDGDYIGVHVDTGPFDCAIAIFKYDSEKMTYFLMPPSQERSHKATQYTVEFHSQDWNIVPSLSEGPN